ncbi:MAG TPA: DMT family transporter, partial [Solirubrobacteraceae bacterium]|nr:DMT family transporter [Solirubrobacteraceae bacterium]
MRPTAITSDAHRSAGIALCLLSAVGFGLMAIFAKEAYAAGLGVTALLAARFALAALLFWAIAGVRARVRGRLPRMRRRAVVACLGLGGIGYATQAGLFFSALEHIDASLASLLLYTYPALVFCGAVALRREHVTRAKAVALVLASAGTALVLLGGGTHGLQSTGVALGLGAGAAYAPYSLVAETGVRRV